MTGFVSIVEIEKGRKTQAETCATWGERKFRLMGKTPGSKRDPSLRSG
jgi:hypothetical protein